MSWGYVAVGAASVVGGLISADGSKKAAKAQANAAGQAIDTDKYIFDKQTELQEPFRQAGLAGQDELMRLLGLAGDPESEGYGSLKSGFMPTNWMDQNVDGGYNFRFKEGLNALQKSAAARGGLLSGNFLKSVSNYGQESASQEYQNAFNRYQMGRASTLNPLQSLGGMAQSSANVMTNAAGQYGANVSETQLGAGNARASGYVGGANAFNGALGGVTNAFTGYQNNQLMREYLR